MSRRNDDADDGNDGGDAFDRFMARGFDVPPHICSRAANAAVAVACILGIAALTWMAGRAVGWLVWR